MNLGPINLFHVPQMYSTRFFSGSPGSVVTPSAVNLDQSSRIYNTETHTNSPGIVRNPTDTTFQSSRKCITKSLVFSPVVKVQNPVP
ncbi:hypothetical protein TNIN_295341 [Trichonephila inaurata madagascariensis]|uniref:Uncharacterized protein n=1 Tax=Trichonephila inaurata madagascariensis TaxID=2747483 RepID=A0A8X6YTB5_9ARAC|nr:hypothetical protein TNIN_295341 [Trichonephila inaurata madagascariensis]